MQSQYHKNQTVTPLPTDDQVKQLKEAFERLNENDNCRYSKKYLKDVLKIDIGDRGGIIRMQNAKGQFELFATVKNVDSNKANLLGEGGFGKVKEIVNLETGEKKVLKVLTQSSPEAKDLFQKEAENLAALEKGNKCVLVKKGQSKKGKLAIVADYVPGAELYKVLGGDPKKISLLSY